MFVYLSKATIRTESMAAMLVRILYWNTDRNSCGSCQTQHTGDLMYCTLNYYINLMLTHLNIAETNVEHFQSQDIL